MTYRLFAVTAPGLETPTMQELAALGVSFRRPRSSNNSNPPGEESGGVEFNADLKDLYRVNLHLRTASRVLLRVGVFKAIGFEELRERAARFPWELYIRPNQPVAIRVTCHKSRLYHSDGVAERIAGAIFDRTHHPVSLVSKNEKTNIIPRLVVVRLVHDVCTLSIDTSGAPLHRRGYRQETAKAPLRETLAAGILIASGWDKNSPILDPFCGSGTIAIEATMLARRIAPGKNRRFAFMDWRNFDMDLWQGLLDDAISQEIPSPSVILASDRDAGGIQIAQNNAARAGVLEDILFSCRAFSAIEPPSTPGWIITNPPYGVRIRSSDDLRDLYSRLGDVFRSVCPRWNIGILCNSDYLIGHTRLRLNGSISMVNGGIPVKFFTGMVP